MRALTPFVVLLTALASASCAKIIGIEETELVSLPANLACVGQVTPPVGNGTQVQINAFIANIATGTPLEGVRVKRCLSRLDVTCEDATVYTSDADGMVSVPVQSGFRGYLRIEDAVQDGASNRLVTYFWYFSQPIVETRAEPFPIYAMTRAYRDLAFYSTIPGGHADRGEVAINVTDCDDVNAVGIRLDIDAPESVDDRTKSFYFASDLIAINPADPQTDVSGLGGYVALLPGAVKIVAVHAASGVAIAEDDLLIQPDVLTTVRLLPE